MTGPEATTKVRFVDGQLLLTHNINIPFHLTITYDLYYHNFFNRLEEHVLTWRHLNKVIFTPQKADVYSLYSTATQNSGVGGCRWAITPDARILGYQHVGI